MWQSSVVSAWCVLFFWPGATGGVTTKREVDLGLSTQLSWGTDKVDLLVEQDRAGGKVSRSLVRPSLDGSSPIVAPRQSLYWAFPADPSSVSIPEQEPMLEGGGFGPPPPNPSFQPIGHV